MSEILYVDEWSSIHIISNLCLGLFSGAKHYSFIKSLAAITAVGTAWEIIEVAYPDSHETMKDHITDMLLNTIGFVTGYAIGAEMKK